MKVAKPPVVPNLQASSREDKYVQGCNVGFSKAITISNEWSRNTEVSLPKERNIDLCNSCRQLDN